MFLQWSKGTKTCLCDIWHPDTIEVSGLSTGDVHLVLLVLSLPCSGDEPKSAPEDEQTLCLRTLEPLSAACLWKGQEALCIVFM